MDSLRGVLPDHYAQPVRVKVPAVRAHFDMLADKVKAHCFLRCQLVNIGSVIRGRVLTIRPETLRKRPAANGAALLFSRSFVAQ